MTRLPAPMALAALLAAGLALQDVPEAGAAADVPRLRRMPDLGRVSDDALFACACPGAVSFCREWKEKWSHQAAPEVRNQSVRECVIDFMSSVTGRPWP